MSCDLRGNGLFEWMKKSTNLNKTPTKMAEKMAIPGPSPKKLCLNHLVDSGRCRFFFFQKGGFSSAIFCQDPGAAADVAGAAAGVCRDTGDVEGEAGDEGPKLDGRDYNITSAPSP